MTKDVVAVRSLLADLVSRRYNQPLLFDCNNDQYRTDMEVVDVEMIWLKLRHEAAALQLQQLGHYTDILYEVISLNIDTGIYLALGRSMKQMYNLM